MVAGRIRQLRYDRDMRQEELIDRTRLDIAHYESGRSVPTLHSLAILCRFFNISLDEFFAPLRYPGKE